MKKNLYHASLLLGAMGIACVSATAQDITHAPDSDFGELYPSHEISFDGFAAGTIGQKTIDHLSGQTIKDHGLYGAGGGVNLFPCRYLGVGGQFYTLDTHGPFVAASSGDLIARLPILDTGLAPYIFGGGGYQSDGTRQGFGEGGGGLEFRFTRNFGIFADARYVIAKKTENYGEGRVGLRVSF